MKEVKVGQVYVKDISSEAEKPSHHTLIYYFATYLSLKKDWVRGTRIQVLCALGEVSVVSISPNYFTYISWFDNAKLIDESQIAFLESPNKKLEKEER